MMGACKFCGQIVMTEAETEAEAMEMATMHCSCASAEMVRIVKEKESDAIGEMRELYNAEKVPEEIVRLMERNIEQMTNGNISKAQYKLTTGRTITVQRNGIKFAIEISKASKQKVEV